MCACCTIQAENFQILQIIQNYGGVDLRQFLTNLIFHPNPFEHLLKKELKNQQSILKVHHNITTQHPGNQDQPTSTITERRKSEVTKARIDEVNIAEVEVDKELQELLKKLETAEYNT